MNDGTVITPVVPKLYPSYTPAIPRLYPGYTQGVPNASARWGTPLDVSVSVFSLSAQATGRS